MFKSILLPVGTSDIDGPDFIVIPWSPELAARLLKRVQAARRLHRADPELTCLRFKAAEALGFSTPGNDAKWDSLIEEMHVANDFLGTTHAPTYFLKRWRGVHLEMPDPPRLSVYPDGSMYYTGPIGLSNLRWETSCGLTLKSKGMVEKTEK